jgi:environmental stress-induced protein Ves
MPKFKLIDANSMPPVPWKNGGGITREIAQADGPSGYAWRLSMADVSAEGAFSTFPNLSRILTVIDGDGLGLQTADQLHDVPFCQPFAFSGDTPISSVLQGGEIRDFNVIFDPKCINADVTVLSGPSHCDVAPDRHTIYAVFGVKGVFSCQREAAKAGSFALIENDAVNVELAEDTLVLLVRLAAI